MKKIVSLFIISIFAICSLAHAQVPAGQEASGLESLRLLQERDFTLRDQIRRQKLEVEEAPIVEFSTDDLPETEKILINQVQVNNATLLSQKEIRQVTDPFVGQKLSLREMQAVANLLTDAYRKKGYVTSRAVLPPQRIQDGVLLIDIIEGTLGSVEIKGNRYFKTELLRKKLELEEKGPFDYVNLQTQLNILNQHPDRDVSAVLAPGEQPGETDIILNVEDQKPIHVGFTYDNYLSRFLDEDRYMVTLTHNNLTGRDDRFTLRYQQGNDENMYQLASMRYIFPVNNEFDIGFHVTRTESTLGGTLSSLNAEGESEIYGVYGVYDVINEDFTTLSLTGGFDYKDITNSQGGAQTSEDRSRNAKIGFNFDRLDKWGRWIVANETNFGIPDILGGNDSVDSNASRSGAGSEFVKAVFDVLRLQNLFWEATILAKGQAQISSRILPASEQFQIGGISNVRGYPPGEFVGDSGQAFTGELTTPLYFVPKRWTVPFNKNYRLYDATRFAAFWDWGRVELRRPLAGETKATTLRSAGAGLRITLPDDLSLRYDAAWPINKSASDNDNVRHWFRVAKEF